MQLRLTAAQQHAILQHLQAGRQKPMAPFPLSLFERGISAGLMALEGVVGWVVDTIAALLRLPKPS
jgi:hypothetical protein